MVPDGDALYVTLGFSWLQDNLLSPPDAGLPIGASGGLPAELIGDDIVAGMVEFVEGIQQGFGPLKSCKVCKKTARRACAKSAASRLGRSGYACPGCSASMA